jgi:hypothetical protein
VTVDDLNSALAVASPITDAEVAAANLDAGKAELMRAIIESTPPPARGEAATSRPRRRFALTFPRVAVSLGLAGAVAVAVTVFGLGSSGGGQQSAYAAEAVRVAEASPRLLVTAPGWTVTGADEFSPRFGEVKFSDGEHELELNWAPASDYQMFYDDRSDGHETAVFSTLLGERVRTVHSGAAGLPDYETMFPPEGETFAYIRGTIERSEYFEVLDSLRRVDVDTWLAAMPSSVVTPSELSETVDGMLQGIPLPPAFDQATLLEGATVADRVQLAARVTGYVTCGWLDSWTQARQRGDEVAMQQAVDAMDTAEDWPILKEIASKGGWDEAVLQYKRRLAKGDVSKRIYDQEMNCIEY